jgi:uncharacterized LabA/DUF88 family protein
MGKKIPSNLTVQLSRLIRHKKVKVYIDGGNFYYSTSKNGLRIDFEQIYNYFKTHSIFQGINYYTAYRPEDPEQEKFLDLLTKYKYSLITKPIKNQNGNIKGNMDIELAVDSLLQAESYEIMVLFSGDGDFAYLVQKLEQLGKQVIVVCVGGFTSFELHTNVGNFFFLDRIQSVWKKTSKKSSTSKKQTLEEIEEKLTPIIVSENNDFFILPNTTEKPKLNLEKPKAVKVKVKKVENTDILKLLTKKNDDSYNSSNQNLKVKSGFLALQKLKEKAVPKLNNNQPLEKPIEKVKKEVSKKRVVVKREIKTKPDDKSTPTISLE